MKDSLQHMKLGDVVDLQSGFAFKSAEYVESGHFLMRIANIQDGHISLEHPKYVALNEKTLRFQLNDGDILTSLTGNIGRVARVEPQHLPAALNQRVARITPKCRETIDDRYLFRFLSSPAFSDFLQARAHGAAQANVSPKTINEVPVPLPPLEEQRRIVAILDEAFEGLDRARENAEVNLQNARELRQSWLESIFSDHRRHSGDAVKEEWRETTLGEVFDIGSSKRVLQRQWKSKGVPFYRAREIVKLAKNGFVENDLYISEEHFDELRKSHGVPSAGDLMVSAVGTLGACYVVGPDDKFYFKDASVLRFHPIVEVCSKFFKYAFQWDGLLDRVKKSDGATVGTFTISRAKGMTITLPPFDEQRRIAAILDKAFERISDVSSGYEAKIADIDELRQSILQKAFAGEMT